MPANEPQSDSDEPCVCGSPFTCLARHCEHDSATGVDQTEGPGKVFRCDGCGWVYRSVDQPDGTNRMVGLHAVDDICDAYDPRDDPANPDFEPEPPDD